MKSLLIIACAFSFSSAFAATSATLLLKGNVAAVTEISVAADAAATALSITGGASALKVATVTETCNDKDGYDIYVASTNAGKLVHTLDSTKSTAYQITYGTSALTTPTATASKIKTVASLSALTTATSDVKVTVTAAPTAVAGDYTDTLTFSIVAK